MKYTAINIGPIFKTIGLARKPRELWAASFLFSDLMRYIMEQVPDNVQVVSPARCNEQGTGVGLYPDRLFIKGEISDAEVKSLIKTAFNKFKDDVFDGADVSNYFSIMNVSVDVDEDYEAVGKLNKYLDLLELNVTASDANCIETIQGLIRKTYDSPLFKHGFASRKMDVETLTDIARVSLDGNVKKSFHNYICVVRADGDNVGKHLTSANLEGNLKAISEALLTFGLRAKDTIIEFGGMPVYAGGDDLMFVSPVVGRDGRTIFELLARLDDEAFDGVRKYIADASLSFGVFIGYHKFPLYEALEASATQLFGVAKNVIGKKAIAWTLQKNSGEQFAAAISRRNPELWDKFMNVVESTNDGNTVTAVAHKVREFAPLIEMTLSTGSDVRLKAMFDKVLEMKDTQYFKSVMEIMPVLYEKYTDKYADALYSILRTAKFIKGEDPIDE